MEKCECVFCKIVAGEIPSHIIWEDEDCIAFLSIFPNTQGVTVVALKSHFTSYVFDLPKEQYRKLMRASQVVAHHLDTFFPNVGRTGMIVEGFGVDHAHTKLVPMHGTGNMCEWKPILFEDTKFFTTYEGYLSSHDGPRVDDAELAKLASAISRHIRGKQ